MTPQDLDILMLKKELIGLGTIVCKSDPAVFIWHYQSQVSYYPFLGELNFVQIVINPIKCVFTIGSEHCAAFKYLGLNISQSNS